MSAFAAVAQPAVEQLLGDSRVLIAVDLIGVFVFGLSGEVLAARKELDMFGVAALAFVAALGGGMLRDVLIGAFRPLRCRTAGMAVRPLRRRAGEVPLVLRRESYALAALLGAAIVAVAYQLDAYGPVPAAAAVLVTFTVRFIAVRRQWNAPTTVTRRTS